MGPRRGQAMFGDLSHASFDGIANDERSSICRNAWLSSCMRVDSGILVYGERCGCEMRVRAWR